jgi:hypothetical protein
MFVIALIGLKMIVEDSNTCSGDFVIYSLLELYLINQNNSIVFIGASQSFSHYSAVLKKLVSSNIFYPVNSKTYN